MYFWFYTDHKMYIFSISASSSCNIKDLYIKELHKMLMKVFEISFSGSGWNIYARIYSKKNSLPRSQKH